ncbi:MAG: hypothetical protein ACTHY8_06095 [Microbacterium gubbeenense]|uniref:hypothetical protein n=1 Tax=Microbacterium gubbeenense TaxID=159896 RepID=UPI0004163596|nr:hypothetical protein [Microbacterium gubbeenense]
MKWSGRARREAEDPPVPRLARHGRHGRVNRSQLTRPPLPAVGSRYDRFTVMVTATADALKQTWPELRDVRFEIGSMPITAAEDALPRWTIYRDRQLIVIHRVVIERLDRAHGLPMHRADDFHKRLLTEGAVFRAAADYLGRDPWDLGADPFH